MEKGWLGSAAAAATILGLEMKAGLYIDDFESSGRASASRLVIRARSHESDGAKQI